MSIKAIAIAQPVTAQTVAELKPQTQVEIPRGGRGLDSIQCSTFVCF